MHKIGILFDIDKLGKGLYGYAAYQIFFEAVDTRQLAGCTLRDGETNATLAGSTNQYCIAVESLLDASKVATVKNALSKSNAKGLAPLASRFVESTLVSQEPLVIAADINTTGELVGCQTEWVMEAWRRNLEKQQCSSSTAMPSSTNAIGEKMENKPSQKRKWWQFSNRKSSKYLNEKLEFSKSSASDGNVGKIKISIWNCPKCSYNFRVRERAIKPIMTLTCKCGWQGKIDTDRKVALNEKEHKLIGTVNAGYKVIAVKDAPTKYPLPLIPAESIVLAKKVSKAPTKYVVWEYVGNGEFRHGVYENDKEEALRIFNSLTNK